MAVSPRFVAGVMAVGPSRMLALWIVVAGLGASILCLSYLPGVAGFAVCGVTLWWAWVCLRLHALQQHAAAVVAVRCGADALGFQLKSGRWLNGQVLPGGMVGPWLTLVRLRDTGERPRYRVLVLMPDSLPPDDHRRLRVYLQWMRVKEADGEIC